jgi:DHA2 family multidrug resistance protein
MKTLFARVRNNGETHPWAVAFAVMLSTFMQVLDSSVANVSLPHIAGDLSAAVDESTWILTSYLVANGIVLPLTGWLSTLFGRKRFYMWSVAIFTVASFLCGVSRSLGMLVFFRVLQGAGGGALVPISQAILVESFPREKRGMAMAVFGMGVIFAPIIGPTLGGWITDNYTWHWIFLINIPVGILSLVLTSLLVFDPPYLVRKNLKQGLKIDYFGLGLLSVGLGFLQVVLDKGQREDWFGSPFIVWCSLLAIVGLVGTLFWELSREDPIVDFRMLKERNFFLSCLAMFMLGLVLFSSTMLLPIFLQTLLGYTAMLSGLVLSPGGIVTLVMLPLVGRLLAKYEGRWLVVGGMLVVSLSLFHMANFNLYIDFRTAMMARIYQSFGFAFLFVPINTMAFYFIPKEKVNNATGLINLARNIGGSVGIALVTTLLARRAQFHQTVLVSHLTPLDSTYRAAESGASQLLMQHGANAPQALSQAQGLIYGNLIRQATMLAFLDAFWLLGLTFMALIPLMFLMKKSPPHKAPTVAAP